MCCGYFKKYTKRELTKNKPSHLPSSLHFTQIIGSPVKSDKCGICGGNGSKCEEKVKQYDSKVRRKGNARLTLIPKGARNVKITLSSLSVRKNMPKLRTKP